MLKRILHSNIHFLWLILFFILHGYSGYIGLISVTDLLILFVQYLVLSSAVLFLTGKLFHDFKKAAVYTTLFMLVFLFFEDIRIFISKWRLTVLLSAFRYCFPLCLLLLFTGLIVLRKIKFRLTRLTFFLNSIFIIYTFIDIVIISRDLLHSKNTANIVHIKTCDTCAKPPVYFIVLDEYFGSKGLRDYFNYDNSAFENHLRQKGFNIITNSHSNYRFTVYSMASILNMDYINEPGEHTVYNQQGFYKAMLGIKNNAVCKTFVEQGYEIINYSDFDIKKHPPGLSYNILPSQRSLISNRTMYYQAEKYLPFFVIRYTNFTGIANSLTKRFTQVNNLRLNKTIEDALKNVKKPTFTYLHLNMPHTPYAYDSAGNNVLYKSFHNLSQPQLDSMYLSYLIYVNKRMVPFIDSLQKVTVNNAVIILLSDHGYRDAYVKNSKLAHQNLFAVYEPGNESGFQRDSITSVNTFRILFNDLFNQHFPLLKDSLVTH